MPVEIARLFSMPGYFALSEFDSPCLLKKKPAKAGFFSTGSGNGLSGAHTRDVFSDCLHVCITQATGDGIHLAIYA